VASFTLTVDLLAALTGSLSGAYAARRQGFDAVGVASLAIAAGLGGGMVRDVLIQHGPPYALRSPAYLAVALIAACVIFVRSPPSAGSHARLSWVVLDAAALSEFAVAGTARAVAAGMSWTAALLLGVITAVGGSVVKDILSGDTPKVIVSNELYAIVAVVVAGLFLGCTAVGISRAFTTTISVSAGITLRIFATCRGWGAPRPRAVPRRPDIRDRQPQTEVQGGQGHISGDDLVGSGWPVGASEFEAR
jgi:uncharacterized membrane protein YeiH